MSTREDRGAQKADTRLGHYGPMIEAAPTAKAELTLSYDWFRAAVTSDRTVRAAARELARLARRADERAAGRAQARGGV